MVLLDVLKVEKPGYTININGPKIFFKYHKIAEIGFTY